MRKLITVIFILCLFLTNRATFALSSIEVEDCENLPPPMVVVYEEPMNSPAPVIEIIIPAIQTPAPTYYQLRKETSTMPPLTATPSPVPSPTPASTAHTGDIAGDYKKGSVYGPYLSTKELQQVKAKVAEIISACIRDGMTDSEKLIALTNYLCDHCSYAENWSKNRANSAWGALVYGEAQCSCYARAMKALCDAVGVGCYYVHASDDARNPSHQWNVVRVDDQWYHLNVQMIDSSYSGVKKPIVLMDEHLPIGTMGVPQTAGTSLILQ